MQQADIDRVQEFHNCIECFLCQNVCHVIRDHEENKPSFAGPRMFIRYAELEMHPLDTNDRRALLQEQMGLGMCNITKCCTEVCPERIHITDNAIIPLKERVVDDRYDPVVWVAREDPSAPPPLTLIHRSVVRNRPDPAAPERQKPIAATRLPAGRRRWRRRSPSPPARTPTRTS